MELKDGFKKTEAGIIPSEWGVAELAEKAKIVDSLHQTPSFVKDGFSMVRVTDIKPGNLGLDGTLKVSEKVYIEFTKNYKPKRGDIVLSRVGSYGVSSYVDTDTPFCMGQNTVVIESKIPDRYLYFVLNSENIREQIENASYGSGYKSLSLKNIKELYIPLPPTKTEQTAIANALSDADALIQSLTRLIAKKRQIKQGTMQTLLNPYDNGRLKAGWVVKKLGDVGVFSKGSGVRKDEAKSGTLPCIRYGEIYTRHTDYIKQFYSFINKDVANTARQLKLGDLLFAGSGETKEEIGKCVAFIYDFEAYAGGDIVILSISTGDALFYGYYLNTNSINKQKTSKGQGDAVVHISASALGNINIVVPEERSEQTHIATILSDMDADITALETKLTKTQHIKQGMMQNLLTVRIRLI